GALPIRFSRGAPGRHELTGYGPDHGGHPQLHHDQPGHPDQRDRLRLSRQLGTLPGSREHDVPRVAYDRVNRDLGGDVHDLIVRGGTVVDGTGAPGRTADVAISDGVVTEVGRVEGAARQEIDADGALVTPGFVDIHTHFDGQVTWDPELTPTGWHGVTTV